MVVLFDFQHRLFFDDCCKVGYKQKCVPKFFRREFDTILNKPQFAARFGNAGAIEEFREWFLFFQVLKKTFQVNARKQPPMSTNSTRFFQFFAVALTQCGVGNFVSSQSLSELSDYPFCPLAALFLQQLTFSRKTRLMYFWCLSKTGNNKHLSIWKLPVFFTNFSATTIFSVWEKWKWEIFWCRIGAVKLPTPTNGRQNWMYFTVKNPEQWNDWYVYVHLVTSIFVATYNIAIFCTRIAFFMDLNLPTF